MRYFLRKSLSCGALLSVSLLSFPLRAAAAPPEFSLADPPRPASVPPSSAARVLAYCVPNYLGGCNTGETSALLADFQIEGTSLNNRNTGCSPNGYGDFTSKSATLTAGQEYTFVATGSPDGGGKFIAQRVSIWIDLNADGTFSAEERVYPGAGGGGNPMQPSLRASFRIPENASLGATRLRVRSREVTEEYDDPCWNYFYGETEDYTVNVLNPSGSPGPTGVCLDLKALLEGPFAEGSSTMQTKLNQRGLLPGQTPVGAFGVRTPAGQPFNVAPWNYNGPETVGSYDADVVDWVLVSLRTDAAQVTSGVYRGAGLLRSDGRITMVGACPQLPTDRSYFVVLEHRNHLGVMTPTAVAISNGKLAFDFTAQQSFVNTNPPSSGQRQVGSRFVLFSSDGLKTPGVQNFDINFNDSALWKGENGQYDRYLKGDFNLDADVNFADQVIWKRNSGRYSGVAH
ncbi:MAG: hypothetical protein H7Y12_10160 [Sphingobacteriaceae bacterium]|nr:hypothetical protein [Cytophagaceae bacterium]